MKEHETYNEFAEHHEISGWSPESYYAELAWNAAVARITHLLEGAKFSGIKDWYETLHMELDEMNTGFKGDEDADTKKTS
jgi:hypothetical protein